jgi:hypothetical protein
LVGRKLYSNARSEALKELYKSKEMDRDRPASVEADFEEVAASCGHFSFSLESFAEEMQNFLTILEELKDVIENNPRRSWKWLRFWQKIKSNQKSQDPEQENLIDQNDETSLPKDIPNLVLQGRRSRSWKSNHEGHESGSTSIYQYLLAVVRFLERDDSKLCARFLFCYHHSHKYKYDLL